MELIDLIIALLLILLTFLFFYKSGEKKLFDAIGYKDFEIEKVRSILENSNNNKKILNLN